MKKYFQRCLNTLIRQGQWKNIFRALEWKKDAYKKRMEAETAVKEAKAAKIVAKNTPPPVVEEAAAPEAEAPKSEE